MQMNWVLLLAALFANRAACEEEFIEPRPWDVWSDGSAVRNFTKNRRYKHGEDIEIRLNSDVERAKLYVWQVNPADKARGQHDVAESMTNFGTEATHVFTWRAQYDIGRYLRHGEDAVYWFGLVPRGEKKPTIESTYVNVSIPDTWKPFIGKGSETTSLVQESPTNQPGPDSTATDKPSREEGKASTRSVLTGPAVVGITLGALVAFTLILIGFCWGSGWMRVARHYQKSHEFELKNMERDVRALRDTVSKLGA
ncbi:hypothetical protein FACUT_3899 [Fusarium acutatum]|uniref:Uncharacterized protein n=1 Tax=Fusarium acutatum TaxID=78861 RepID=A0A8H4JZF4_9HYPO|nr:hypothetical protein FACUT_3899 [Fusarium acutatum]